MVVSKAQAEDKRKEVEIVCIVIFNFSFLSYDFFSPDNKD